ncbi:hypothetical protein GGS20DRAFT_327909 [Poronia punctata]|nr:hypothetical protein GGS20DRAFT_327909 [Poronia punctata]
MYCHTKREILVFIPGTAAVLPPLIAQLVLMLALSTTYISDILVLDIINTHKSLSYYEVPTKTTSVQQYHRRSTFPAQRKGMYIFSTLSLCVLLGIKAQPAFQFCPLRAVFAI